MSITWHEDNSMDIEHTIDGSVAGATVTATIVGPAGTQVGDPITLAPTGTDDHYAATVHPTGAYDLPRTKHLLRIEATFGGATLESEEAFTPRVRRTS